jgi:ferritin-like metal-binding protein YciE
MAGLLLETEDCLRLVLDAPLRETVAISCLKRVKHYEIAAYSAAKSYAARLDQGRTVALLSISLSEEIGADTALARLQELEWKQDAIPAGAL